MSPEVKLLTEQADRPANLTTDRYWDEYWHGGRTDRRRSRLPRSFAEAFSEHAFKALCQPYLGRGAAVLELGSAPGTYLVELHRQFGVNPWGVDYSAVGAAMNRRTFQAAGLNPSQVIEADIFAPAFQNRYAERFDVVLSRGFLEHFTDPERAVAAHCRLLRRGGHLVVQIPNYRGGNYALKRLFCPGNLAAHNRKIMRLVRFRQLFQRPDLHALFCGYLGTCHLNLCQPEPGRAWLRPLYELLSATQVLLNGPLCWTFGAAGPESAWISPYLAFAGRKD